ncbi:hypothetical protein Avbf_17317 [Armadillidium vulgare]|nr:hypothetical protein Avbf_17317 [Armadillidium vulgare]
MKSKDMNNITPWHVFLNLGDKEVTDQLAVVRYLKENLHFIDEKRIVIWGWNYGGFVSTMALAKDAEELFSCGIAVSPITHWEHYNSVFSERYMGSPRVFPGGNYKGYEEADVTKMAGNLKHTKYLLIHGTANRHVHFHHTMMLSRALAEENVIFRQIVYPDQDNSLSGNKYIIKLKPYIYFL